jgi:hypothetical protein
LKIDRTQKVCVFLATCKCDDSLAKIENAQGDSPSRGRINGCCRGSGLRKKSAQGIGIDGVTYSTGLNITGFDQRIPNAHQFVSASIDFIRDETIAHIPNTT